MDFSLLSRKLADRDKSMRDLMPSELRIEAVKGCPFSCVMCALNQTRVNLVSEDVLRILEPCFPHLEVLSITGSGEPLIGDIGYFVEQSLKHDFVLHMNTNGILLKPELSDLLLKTRLSIRFSINAGTPETYWKVMGAGFEKVLSNVEYLVRKTEKSEKQHDLWFSFIYMKENMHEVAEFMEATHRCGIRSVRFIRLMPHLMIVKGRHLPGRKLQFRYNDQMNNEVVAHFRRCYPEYAARAKALGVRIEFSSMMAGTEDWSAAGEFVNLASKKLLGRIMFPVRARKGMCVVPWIGQMGISQNGDVSLCCGTTLTLGNIHERSLEEIWNSPVMQGIRESFAKGKLPRLCGYCRGIDLSDRPNNAFIGLER